MVLRPVFDLTETVRTNLSYCPDKLGYRTCETADRHLAGAIDGALDFAFLVHLAPASAVQPVF